MALIFQKDLATDGTLAIWEATEELGFFKDNLSLTKEEESHLNTMKPHRSKEWLVSRFLLHKISGDEKRVRILKDENGRPYREGCNKFVSISHSKEFVAAVVSNIVVGIDIQNPVDKIYRIQHKFISDKESQYIESKDNSLEYYHLLWGSKESMYKAYSKKELDFRKNMYVYPFELFDSKLEFSGKVEKGDIRQEYDLYYENVNNNYLVYCTLSK